MSDRDDFSAFLIGFVLGGLTGAVVSLLFAPQSGVETRALIKDKAIELGDKASDTAEEAYARAEAAALEARDKADKLAKLAKERAAELQQRGQVIIDEQRVKLTNVIENARKSGKQEAADTTPPSAEA
jgi:gas vesicle protein